MKPKRGLDTTPARPAAARDTRENCPLQRSPRRSKNVNLVLVDVKPTQPEVATAPKKRGRKPMKAPAREVPHDSGQRNLISLSREDVKCAICLEIFVEPVTYPCGHSACLACYKEHVEKTSMQCHLCRSRLSVWSRAAFKKNSLVDIPFWERIQQEYGEEIDARQDGDSQSFGGRSPTKEKVLDGTIASQGEIFQEFDEQRKRFSAELEVERQREEEASLELIKKLEEEEGPLPPVQSASELEKDLELARRLQEELQAGLSPPSTQVTAPRPKRSNSVVIAPNPPQNQTKLTFKKSVPPSATVSSLEEQERQTPTTSSQGRAFPIPTWEPPLSPRSASQIDEDFRLAKKLQYEEKKAVEKERQAKMGRPSTRFLSKGSGGTPGSTDKKRHSPRPSTSQGSKRLKQDLSQGTLDKYVTTSPPASGSAAAVAPPRVSNRSRSSTPDSINAEFNHHFQPIVRPPKTPPKRNPDGSIENTVVFVNLSRVSPKNLSSAFTTPTKED